MPRLPSVALVLPLALASSLAAAAPAAPAVRPFYPPDEAVRDATSGRLELVGVGEWPGAFRRLACIYRNERVFVVDEKCSGPEESNLVVVHVLSPARGRATIYAEIATGKIGAARRADYKTFSVGSALPWPAPARLDLAMSYEDVIAYQAGGRGKVPVSCSAGTQRPQGWCSKEAPVPAAAYVADVDAFVKEPGDAWTDLVKTLMAQRAQAHASIHPAQLPTPRLAAWAASWARDQEVTVTDADMKRVGNPDGWSASIARAADGGVLVAGLSTQGGVATPTVIRADADGRKRWVVPLPDKASRTAERAAVAAAPDGALVLAQGYPDPAWKPTYRVVRLDDRGKVRWQWVAKPKDHHKIPQVVAIKLTPKGGVALRGYIQLVADGDVHGWTAELDGKGKLLREEVGEVLADHGASME